MAALDFKEIPTSGGGPDRDQFELFAREFLEFAGFKIITNPDRGADGGRDLIVEEIRTGIAGESRVRWLVSCKHKAHAGASVTPEDERDIHDRVPTHACSGFMGFYSTLPSSGLAAKLVGAKSAFDVHVFDREKIEARLLSSPAGITLAKRFFPKSVEAWLGAQRSHANVFTHPPSVVCEYCSQSLLHPTPHGIVVVWSTSPLAQKAVRDHTEVVYACCKGACDDALKSRYRNRELLDGWEDIDDLVIPLVYLRWCMTMFNEFQRGHTYTDEALQNMKDILMNLFPLVCRDMTSDEKERMQQLQLIPAWAGGWGSDA